MAWSGCFSKALALTVFMVVLTLTAVLKFEARNSSLQDVPVSGTLTIYIHEYRKYKVHVIKSDCHPASEPRTHTNQTIIYSWAVGVP